MEKAKKDNFQIAIKNALKMRVMITWMLMILSILIWRIEYDY